jgi:hypothetical protein
MMFDLRNNFVLPKPRIDQKLRVAQNELLGLPNVLYGEHKIIITRSSVELTHRHAIIIL